jgi:hypothetical protein
MDVNGLNRDCRLSIHAWTPEGTNGMHFVPLYRLSWSKKAKPPTWAESTAEYEWKPVASVVLLLPTKTIRQLQVDQSEYILRKPLEITNLDFLLSQTNAPIMTNSAITP